LESSAIGFLLGGRSVREGNASLTALGAATHRAVHQLVDIPKVFDDPLALRILGEDGLTLLKERLHRAHEFLHLRAFIVGRSRFAEDTLSEAVKGGVGQLVILGAGLDTFAYRNSYPASELHVFEVDHPATQKWKRDLLAAAGIPVPATLTFTPVDFEHLSLREGLESVGFRFHEPAFFSLLGVVPYLERNVLFGTLAFIKSEMQGGAEVVFDYVQPPSNMPPIVRDRYNAMVNRVATVGEPLRTSFDTNELVSELQNIGFAEVQDVSPSALNSRYFAGRPDGLQVGPVAHIVRARR
jgi:methyltransferase (TIGR00027 family)